MSVSITNHVRFIINHTPDNNGTRCLMCGLTMASFIKFRVLDCVPFYKQPFAEEVEKLQNPKATAAPQMQRK